MTVPVMDVSGRLHQFDVIVDTGFTGWIMLPDADIRRLGLIQTGFRDGILASGNTERFPFFETRVSWHGPLRVVEIFRSIDQPLLGMELLEGSRITVDAREGGAVVVEEA